ncbi:MAG: DUF5723 family protein [Calditrichota bacterium]
MKTKWIILILLLAASLCAQQSNDARAAGMAFSNVADARGLGASGLNPASYALPTLYNMELNFFSASVNAANNSFNKDTYDSYFTTGDFLTETDKSNILSSIPSNGIEGNMRVRMNTLSIYAPRFTLGVTAMADGDFVVPKEVAELAFYGNKELGKTYDFSSVDGSAWGGMAINFALAFPLNMENNKLFKFFSIGANGKYYGGMGYANVESATGSFVNASFENQVMQLDGEAELLTARGGNGFGLDIGVIAQSYGKWSHSFSVNNVMGNITWNNQPEIRRYNITSDSLTLTVDGIEDSLIVSEDTTFATGAFSTRLPLVLDYGTAFQASNSWLFTGRISKGFAGDLYEHNLEMSFGSEFSWIPFLPLRAGISFGGMNKMSTAVGVGLNMSFFYIDLGLVNHGSFLPGTAEGVTISASSRLRL